MIDKSQINLNLDKLHQHFDSVLEMTQKAGPCLVKIKSI